MLGYLDESLDFKPEDAVLEGETYLRPAFNNGGHVKAQNQLHPCILCCLVQNVERKTKVIMRDLRNVIPFNDCASLGSQPLKVCKLL